MNRYLLAIDIGTSACKVAIFSPSGQTIAEHSTPYPVFYPEIGWAEQDPNDWWNAACTGIKACLEKSNITAKDIAGIGVDGQSWACIPIDSQGTVLANTPIWMDTRATNICAKITDQIGEDAIFSISGNPFQPSYTTPKILWFKQFSSIYNNTKYFLQSNSFIVYRLTGIASQEKSQGYGLHVFDITNKCYHEPLAKDMGINTSQLPPIYDSHSIVGPLQQAAANATGLLAGTPVVAGGLDAACGTLGAGVYKIGQTQEQGGQAGGMSICLSQPLASKQLILSPHVVPDMWLLQGGTVAGGAAIKWAAQEFGAFEEMQEKETGISRFALLDKLAAQTPAGADGLVFLPYLAGERSPIWNPHAAGVFFGMNFSTTKGHFFRAVMEGTAFALQHNLEIAEQVGAKISTMHAIGGAANSSFWTQIKSDITQKKILVPDSDLATCKGTAILAGMGTGIYTSFEDAIKQVVSFKQEYTPNPNNQTIYQNNYTIYKDLYSQLKPVMEKSAQQRRNPL